MADKAKKPKADWEAIEREYRTGQLSVREIARQHGVSHVAIGKKAKAGSWVQNLTEAVRQRAEALLVTSEVTSGNSREAIDVAATTRVQVVRSHRSDIQMAREEASALLGELRDTRLHLDVIDDAIEASGEKSEAKRRMRQAISLGDRAATLRELSNSIKNFVGLERQAFNIDPKGADTPDPKNQGERLAEVNKDLDEIFDDPKPEPVAADAPGGG